jgi:hypothetical protein
VLKVRIGYGEAGVSWLRLKLYCREGGHEGVWDELHRLAGAAQGETNRCIVNMVRSLAPLPDQCPQRLAVQCFTIRIESKHVHVLWARVERRRQFWVLYVVEDRLRCPPMAAYEVARGRLSDVLAR